jgi:hypothetical protein
LLAVLLWGKDILLLALIIPLSLAAGTFGFPPYGLVYYSE